MTPHRRLLTPDEAAAYLTVTRTWLMDQAQAGRIERVQLGGQTVRFTQQALDELIARCTRPAHAAAIPAPTATTWPVGLPRPVGRRRHA